MERAGNLNDRDFLSPLLFLLKFSPSLSLRAPHAQYDPIIEEHLGVSQLIQISVIKDQVGVSQLIQISVIKDQVGVSQLIQISVIKDQVGVR